jgi:acyl-CoA reductase-like NAD-dependent aldehyde dehydrogenase
MPPAAVSALPVAAASHSRVGSREVPGGAGRREVVSPSDGQPFASVSLLDASQAAAAVTAAVDAFPAWSARSFAERGQVLLAVRDRLVDRAEEIAALIEREQGKPAAEAYLVELFPAAELLKHLAQEAEELLREEPVEPGVALLAHKEARLVYEPLGVVLAITPWNYPFLISVSSVATALAAGNTVVLKPAELTPMTALRIAELALEAGLPEGVFTVVAGKGSVVGQRFVTHPAVRKVAFTGSTEVGKQIMAGCADQVKRVTLELGGKSANIVFADTDVAAAAASAPYAVFDNAGQDCCARSRILVQRSAYDEFVGRLETSVKALRVIDPADEQSEMGPLVSASQRDSVRAHLDGASIAFTGSAPDGPGWWLPPTVVESVDTSEPIWREEVFGPVVAVMAFDDEDEAVALANDSDYGLSGSIFTSDVGRALRVSRRVEAGNLSVNSHSSVRYWTPFGGYKQSGLGRELGPDAPHAFTEEKNVFIAH